jgi:hypothetical protein
VRQNFPYAAPLPIPPYNPEYPRTERSCPVTVILRRNLLALLVKHHPDVLLADVRIEAAE